MSHIKRLLLDLWEEENAAVLALVSLALVLVLGLAAFATDLGWFYVNTNRIQRAADAASLAGVIHMPQDPPDAVTDAHASALTNGYADGVDNALVVPVPAPNGEIHQLQVTITDTVDTFFLRVFGQTSQTISRRATAEYIPPLPMGSRDNTFGNDIGCAGGGPGCSEFWANIHGQYTDTRMGDAHSSWCNDGGGSGFGCGGAQPGWRSKGYIYAVEVIDPAVTSFTIQMIDMNLHVPGGDPIRTGDHNVCGGCGGAGHTVQVTAYRPDPTPLDLSDNPPVGGSCTQLYPPMPDLPVGDPFVWDTHCTVTTGGELGLYPIRIRIDPNTAPADSTGLNRYSIRAVASGGTVRLYGIGDISLFNNITAGAPNFDLAEVDSSYRGKTFVIEMYDPGDAQNNVPNIINVVGPGSSAPWGSCRFYTRDEPNQSWSFQTTLTPCAIDATRPANNYNGIWLKAEIDLPDTYNCVDCWWEIDYSYSGTAQDTTTWRAYIIGNPVHLIPNG